MAVSATTVRTRAVFGGSHPLQTIADRCPPRPGVDSNARHLVRALTGGRAIDYISPAHIELFRQFIETLDYENVRATRPVY
jgi:hypothetical protein